MIAPGNHNFKRFAALCNTPGEAKAAAPLREAKSLPYMACAILQPPEQS